MHAFLIVGNNKETIPDQVQKIINEQKAKHVSFTLQKVEDTRELKKFVKFNFNEKTAIVINNIDNATIEASNAFLKNLEEPTKNIIYILTATNINNVLPTIMSRCQIIKIEKQQQVINNKNINFKDALNIKDRSEAINFIEDLMNIDHDNGEFKNMENYLVTLKNLKANGNVSLQLTAFVVRMNGHGR